MKVQWSKKNQNIGFFVDLKVWKRIKSILDSPIAVAVARSTVLSLFFAVLPTAAAAELLLSSDSKTGTIQIAQTGSPSNPGATYARLSNLLAADQWRAADIETTQLLLQLANKERIREIRTQDINQLSCEALSTLDKMWQDASNGNFGFSIQSHVYRSLGGTREFNAEISEQASLALGWEQEYLDPNYTFWIDKARFHEEMTGRAFQSFPPGFPASEEEAMQVSEISY